MSNGTNDVSGAVTNLIDTFGKLAQQQIDVLNNAVKTAASLVDPLTKTATDLAGTLLNTCNQVLQSVSAAIAPKK
ncbi:MAG: chlorosome envelope protein B [Chlorobiaceae bacterium]|nr:chlorosome envelope protein B [Chlorobiaceae bacterium]NTW10469.1 chlorosome envelope protein B [Chlorobiaceae bacterium]